MKNTLRLIAAAAVLAIAAPVYAQSGGGGGGMGQMSPEQRIARQKEMLFKDITLDAGQTTKIDAIFQESTKKQQELMQGGMEAMRSPEGREKMQKLNNDRNDAIKAVLTADQKKKFEENLAAMPQGRRGGL
ncbi:hypothetical protein [Gemmatimonas aurantiaca]|uniref:hypothetical protein n=1 Tax=Gemmatimonas aurantiaca TaxID=173480 RepID=UPI00301C3CE1